MLNSWLSQPLEAACSGCALAGAAMLAAGLYLRRRGYGRRSISPLGAASVTALATGILLAAVWWFGLREAPWTGTLPPLNGVPFRADDAVPPNEPLAIAIGDELPSLLVDGWLNGATPTLQQLAGKVIVIDIWNEL